jgi:hypothetical protein
MSGSNRKATGRYFSEVGMQSSKQAKVQQVRSPDRVIINDVGPRDGLQNQAKILTPAERVQLVRALLAAGMDHVEVGAFVSPKAVPAMAGTDEVLAGLPNTSDEVLTVLIPNLRGYELAMAAGAKSVCMVPLRMPRQVKSTTRSSGWRRLSTRVPLNWCTWVSGQNLTPCAATRGIALCCSGSAC